MAKWAAIRFTADHILDFIEVDDSHAIFEVEMPRQWVGKTVGQLNIRQKYNINIVAIKRGENINMSISSETTLKEGETLLVIGEYKTLQRCFQM